MQLSTFCQVLFATLEDEKREPDMFLHLTNPKKYRYRTNNDTKKNQLKHNWT